MLGSVSQQSDIDAISRSKLFLCVLSENAYSCQFVQKELEYVVQNKDIIVLPVIVDESQLPHRLSSLAVFNVLNWRFTDNLNIDKTIIKDVCCALGKDEDRDSMTDRRYCIAPTISRPEGVGNNRSQAEDVDSNAGECSCADDDDWALNKYKGSDTRKSEPSSIENNTLGNVETFEPTCDDDAECESVRIPDNGIRYSSAIGGSFWKRVIGAIGGIVGAVMNKSTKANTTQVFEKVYSSIFAPAEVKRKSHLLVQVFFHLFEETEMVKALAKEAHKDAERRGYVPLQCRLKKGDKVDVQLSVYGEMLMMSEKKSVVWQGSFTKCDFDYFVPKEIDIDELSCVVLLTVNSIPVGEMRFITNIVDNPRQLNPEVIAHIYDKVFISYSHQDESKVRFLHEGLELGGIPNFFDRSYLKPGDIFPQKIRDYINTADLFILCWSENASKSEYVQKERLQALERAFPQVQPENAAKLRIYPMSIEPHAELPEDMRDNYHFGVI